MTTLGPFFGLGVGGLGRGGLKHWFFAERLGWDGFFFFDSSYRVKRNAAK